MARNLSEAPAELVQVGHVHVAIALVVEPPPSVTQAHASRTVQSPSGRLSPNAPSPSASNCHVAVCVPAS
ncbi:MAG: hypothetical protein R6V58_15805 [Planctomycetota bacterium]